MNYIDISPTLSPRTAVFPGDTPFVRRIALSFQNGDDLLLSAMESTLHLGAHADGPNHYHAAGVGIDRRDLSYYLGPCQVVEVRGRGPSPIRPEDIRGVELRAPRVLFKTLSYPDPEKFNEDFRSVSSELIDVLAEEEVVLVGIDTPSVDPADSRELQAHRRVYHHDMAILEQLVLVDVDPGLYCLVALPLKIEDGDASPVRAILLPDPQALAGADL